MSVLDRTRKLLALATADSASVGERTNAAVNACKLIVRFGLLASDAPQPAGPSPFAGPTVSIEDILRQHVEGTPDAPKGVPSAQVAVPSRGVCRLCLKLIDSGAQRHRVPERGSQCLECGPWRT